MAKPAHVTLIRYFASTSAERSSSVISWAAPRCSTTGITAVASRWQTWSNWESASTLGLCHSSGWMCQASRCASTSKLAPSPCCLCVLAAPTCRPRTGSASTLAQLRSGPPLHGSTSDGHSGLAEDSLDPAFERLVLILPDRSHEGFHRLGGAFEAAGEDKFGPVAGCEPGAPRTPYQQDLSGRLSDLDQGAADVGKIAVVSPRVDVSAGRHEFGPGAEGELVEERLRCRAHSHSRIEDVAPGRIYAKECIIFHDSASVLTSQRQLLRNLFT